MPRIPDRQERTSALRGYDNFWATYQGSDCDKVSLVKHRGHGLLATLAIGIPLALAADLLLGIHAWFSRVPAMAGLTRIAPISAWRHVRLDPGRKSPNRSANRIDRRTTAPEAGSPGPYVWSRKEG